MSAFKQFTSKDVIITPFSVGKKYAYVGNELTGSDIGIDIFQGINNTTRYDGGQGSVLPLNPTGLLNKQYKSLVYNNIKQLYYTNQLPNNDAQFFAQTASYFIGNTATNHRYENYLASLISESRYFPTESNAEITVISIPSKAYGNSIVPNSFAFTYQSRSIVDDGEGNILTPDPDQLNLYGTAQYGINVYGSGATPIEYIGNIIYSHGIIILTSGSLWTGIANSISASVSALLPGAAIAFSSSINVYENQYKCTTRENEFNFSQNPSILSGSNYTYGSGSYITGYSGDSDILYGFATASYFSPYVTTVGLYNEMQELMAVGKLAQPLQSSRTTDTTILVNFDT